MSEKPAIDLSELNFLPSWAKEPSSSEKYANHPGDSGSRYQEGSGRQDRGRSSRPRPPGGQGGPGGSSAGRGPKRDDRRPGGNRGRDSRGGSSERRPAYVPPPPLPVLNVDLLPDDKGVLSLAQQIKTSGKAYAIFEIARMILQKAERYGIQFSAPKDTPPTPLFSCTADGSLWLTEGEAVKHLLSRQREAFYREETVATEPPKGQYPFVAVCGTSGIILGPPNYHSYQTKLMELYRKRFSHSSFEEFKSRIKMVRDEAVVKQWQEEQSKKVEYIPVSGENPPRLGSLAEVETHFAVNHKSEAIHTVETAIVPGNAFPREMSPGLATLARRFLENESRHPIHVVNRISEVFAKQNLRFFKGRKNATHVAVAKPRYLDAVATPVSDGIRRIVEFIQSHPGTRRGQLLELLPPAPAPAEMIPVVTPEPSPEPAAAAEPESTVRPGEKNLWADLHWLLLQGHVLEYSDGMLETVKAPAPRPPAPEKKPAAAVTAPSPQKDAAAPAPVSPPASGPEPSA